ncbi:MAG: hypothetical protein WC292_07575 [Clostridia bacterium]
MIFKIKKGLYNTPDDYAVRSEVGEVFCKIARLKKGYYLYNKLGEQIAQVTFDKNTASLNIARRAGNSMDTTKLVRTASDNFSFVTNEVAKEDTPYLDNLRGQSSETLSIWGDTATYNYDIFNGSKVAANIVPSTTEPTEYTVKMGETGNLIKIIMVAIAAERLNNDPFSKH